MRKDNLKISLHLIRVLLVDLVIIFASTFLSYLLLYNFNPVMHNLRPFIVTAPIVAFSYIIIMKIYSLDRTLRETKEELIFSVLLTVITLAFTIMAINFFTQIYGYPRRIIVFSPIIQFIFLSIWRVYILESTKIVHGVKNTIIIYDKYTEELAKKIILTQGNLYNLKYLVNINNPNLFKYISECEVVFINKGVKGKIKEEVFYNCLDKRKNVYIVPSMYDASMIDIHIGKIDDIPVLELKKLGLTSEEKFFKRAIDIIFSIIALIILSPVFLIVSIGIKLDGGTVFYKQDRVTANGNIFSVIKFRTMIKDAEKYTGPTLSEVDDERITKFGKFLRRTRLDEIPQLINIIAGDMSIVGPRPERPVFVEQYLREIPEYKYRTYVKAGLTGFAQIMGKYNTSANTKILYDIIYIKNYSIWLDFKIMLQTVKTIFIKSSTEGIMEEESLEEIKNRMNLNIVIE